MSKVIKIHSITSMAMSEDAGMLLRKEMREAIQQGENIVLDFEEIS